MDTKKIELRGCSDKSWEDATRRAVTQAVQAAGTSNRIQVKQFEATIAEGKVSQFCVWIEVLAASVSAGLSRPARVLVADDLEPIQKIARSILEGAGHEVDTVSDGAEALARVQSKAYDLVLMDIQMPTMDGIASTRAIRALASPAGAVPILAVTTNVLPEHVRTYRAAGMNDYVRKPLNQSDLLRKLNEWLPATSAAEQPANIPGQPVPQLFDRQAHEDLRAMMGSERVSEWIAKFLQQLEAIFPPAAEKPLSRELLARDVHALGSQAALLGFPEFSSLCSELEEACISGRELDAPFRRTCAAARLAESQARNISHVDSDKAIEQ